MKIVRTDNLDRDYVPDKLVASNVSEHEGDIMVKALRATCTDDGTYWYLLVEDSYRLKDGGDR